MKNIKGLVGTYGSQGIYAFEFDGKKGIFTKHKQFLDVKESKYLSVENGNLVSVGRRDSAGIMQYQKSQVFCDSKEEHVACYITQDDTYIYTANYHDGTIIRYGKEPHLHIIDVVLIKEKAGTHQVLLKSNELIVPSCLLDIIQVYNRDTMEIKMKIPFPIASGPRHGVLTKDESMLYVLSEISCELYAIDVEANYEIKKKLPLLNEGERGAAAAIRMSKDEKYLYVSIRNINKLYVLDIKAWKLVQDIDCGGEHPRDMNISPQEDYVFVANRDSHTITAFYRDKKQGRLTYVDTLYDIPEGVSIDFIEGGTQDEKK